MQEIVEHRPGASEFTPRGRVVITVLLSILPIACFALALTSPPGSERAWMLIAVANLIIPAVMLPLVWRGARGRRSSETAPAPDSAPTEAPADDLVAQTS